MNSGCLHKFLFDGLPVRGALVRLTESWREALERRAAVGAFAPPVRALLGEMAAAGMLMQSSIKFDGSLVLQLHGDGPVALAVAEVKSELSFRTTAKVVGEVASDAGLQEMVNAQGGGRCAITLDARTRPAGTPPYQGMVPLHGDRHEPLEGLAQVLEHYMLQSEQLDTRLVLAANDEVAAGLLLQRMPLSGALLRAGLRDEDRIGIDDDFNRLAQLGASLTRQELLTLDPDTLLHRLFWEDDLLRYEPLPARFDCSCSEERVRHMLTRLGRPELDDILTERGMIEVSCEFCGKQYRFDAVDVEAMFTPERDRPAASSTLQ